MAKSKRRVFWLVYGTLLSLWTVFVGALFIAQVWAIFRSAPSSPFTTSIIKEKFSEIALFVWIWVAVTAFGGVLSLFFTEEEARPKAYTDVKKTLLRLKNVMPADGEGMATLYRKRRARCIAVWVCSAILTAICALCAVWLFNTSYTPTHDSTFFTEHGAVADRLFKMLPWLLAGMLVWSAAVVFRAISLQSEIDYVKAAIAQSKKKGTTFIQGLPYQPKVEKIAPVFAPKKTAAEKAAERRLARNEEYVLNVGLAVGETLVENLPVTELKESEQVLKHLIAECLEEEFNKQCQSEAQAIKQDRKEAKAEKKAFLQYLKAEKSFTKAELNEQKAEQREERYSTKEREKFRREKTRFEKKQGRRPKKLGWLVWTLRIGLCAAAVVLIVIGISNGGMVDVYEKAKNICTQCIGLG